MHPTFIFMTSSQSDLQSCCILSNKVVKLLEAQSSKMKAFQLTWQRHHNVGVVYLCQHPDDITSFSKMATADEREAGQDDPESEDEVYEVVDLTEYARRHQWWSRVFGNNSGPIAEKYSVATQLMMGGVTGWCAGYVFQRVGKIAATAIGGGFLLLQIANHSGYVQVDWKKVEKDVNKAKKHLKKKANKAAPEINTFIEEVKATDFIKRNIVLSSGFVGGFFLGLAS
ncbi:FUN14 domain-containing protein 1 isoform X1 [Maylandia zebra]|nr:FUN14 domain-containing protein 1 isoform X1 [Maylandia zebra]XP_005920050.1 FUN14 domain-containing protein 1 isoform X1 [Haplochromis burtoni]XP_026013848.1 FUN14 domain-containing protein 1 isoform X1 [Astatotilapia calliptera]